jgi:transcriptional regulator with AAA-type ATPase domain
MHSVWLILYAGGVFPDGTRLVSSQINRKTGGTTCDNVDFPIDTYLSELRRYEKENPKEAIYKPEYVKSEARKKALEQIRVYASIQGVPMLLLGERGIGKSRLVESVVSKIKKKDVVSVACGTLDSNLAESAMFGHKKGSFTGATADKKGYFGEADGKILFLDEIQDLPKGVQRKLLRTLQDKKHRYRIVGDDKESTADVELVCASNLTDSELRKKLDPDFYDRISFYRVVIPPLRECREDIETDWNEVWKTVRLDSSPKDAPMDKYLEKYFRTSRLFGNFRTLQSIAYQFIAWNGKKTIEEILNDLPADDSPNGSFDIGEFSEFQNLNWKEAIKLFQQKLAKYSCDKYGTQEAAAQKLECTSKTLQNAMK